MQDLFQTVFCGHCPITLAQAYIVPVSHGLASGYCLSVPIYTPLPRPLPTILGGQTITSGQLPSQRSGRPGKPRQPMAALPHASLLSAWLPPPSNDWVLV